MKIKDGYLEFFDFFNVEKEKLIKFGLDKVMICNQSTAKSEWINLKRSIINKDEMYIRGYGRSARGTILYQHLYALLFNVDKEKIIEDPSNNSRPAKLIQKWTGYNKSGAKQNIQNYQVSHIFGKTKNPYMFTAPFNIMFIPKILDPFTGHESKGEISSEFKKAIQSFTYQKFTSIIEDYNQTILNKDFQERLRKSLDQVIQSDN